MSRSVDHEKLGECDRTDAQTGGTARKKANPKNTAIEGGAPSSSQSSGDSGEHHKAGKTGETGVVSNGEFIGRLVCGGLPDGVFPAVCTKPGNPEAGYYVAHRWDRGDDPNPDGSLNAYLNCGVFAHGKDASFRARLDRNRGVLFLMLDDLGTKVPLERLGSVTPTWLLETSPGNFQAGFAFTAPVDGDTASAIHAAMIIEGLCDEGAGQPKNRWARLPHAINGKPKHARDGQPWQCRLTEWNPDAQFTPEELIDAFGLEPLPVGKRERRRNAQQRVPAEAADPLYIPAAAENPVIAALKAAGLYKTPLGSGKHDIVCPWVSEHTDAHDSGACYFEPTDEFPTGGFKCQHSHGDRFSVGDLLESLGVTPAAAREKPLIRVVAGSLARVVDGAERLLAEAGTHFQQAGVIVSIDTDMRNRDPRIVVTSEGALLYALSAGATWEKWDAKNGHWTLCDPPARHLKVLSQSQPFRCLQRLVGLARQPFFSDDGVLVTEPGYHPGTGRFGVFNPRDFVFPESFTREAAEEALGSLEALLSEFPFVSEHDRSAAIAGMLTGAMRSSLRVAPAFHIRAPEYGSGKSYLADLIILFAGPAGKEDMKMSYPVTSEEATKAMLAALLPQPAAIVFDDMQSDWIPHGSINRMLTSEWITDRILGESRTATASTRTLILGTGNNVGPSGDLLRRVLTIQLDHKESLPATKAYAGDPVADVTSDRGRYVAAALTIIATWRAAGAPKADCCALAGYGDWSEACRQSLLWLGLPDPATAMFEQMKGDEQRDTLGFLLGAWFKAFGDQATTVRKAVARAPHPSDLREAFDEAGVIERGEINCNKLGWALKRYTGRIAKGLKLVPTDADGRKAWRVISVAGPPVSPAFVRPSGKGAICDDDASLVQGDLREGVL